MRIPNYLLEDYIFKLEYILNTSYLNLLRITLLEIFQFILISNFNNVLIFVFKKHLDYYPIFISLNFNHKFFVWLNFILHVIFFL